MSGTASWLRMNALPPGSPDSKIATQSPHWEGEAPAEPREKVRESDLIPISILRATFPARARGKSTDSLIIKCLIVSKAKRVVETKPAPIRLYRAKLLFFPLTRASCKSHLLRHSAKAGIQNGLKILDSGSRFACPESRFPLAFKSSARASLNLNF